MQRASALRIWTVGLGATACAVGANLLILFAGKQVLDIPEAFMPTDVGPVVFFTKTPKAKATPI